MHRSTHLVASTLVAAVALGTIVFSQQAPTVSRTVLRGATVIDVVAGTTVPDAVIVIEGDRIAAFGGRTTPMPQGATVVDLPREVHHSGVVRFPRSRSALSRGGSI